MMLASACCPANTSGRPDVESHFLVISNVVVPAFLPSAYPSHALVTRPSFSNLIRTPWMCMSFSGSRLVPPSKTKIEFVGRGVGSVELHPRLVPCRTVVRHPQFVAIEMVNRNHLVGHSRKLGLDQSTTGTG